jgi:SAM-dependent methyltransferase
MKSKAYKYFRKFPFLVKIIRFARQISPMWRNISNDYEQEARFEKILVHRQKVIEEYLTSNSIKKLQVGAGRNPLPGWLNTDYEPTANSIIFLDATTPFPFNDAAFDYVFSEHMIEHISYLEGIIMMKEVFRVLKPGGKVRIATPDINYIVGLFSLNKTREQHQYIEYVLTEYMGLYSPSKSKLHGRRPEYDIDFEHVRRYYPNVNEDGVCFIVNQFFRGFGHQFLYDEHSLGAIMKEAGFENICRYKPKESDDINLQGIESHGSLIGEMMSDFETMVLEGSHR